MPPDGLARLHGARRTHGDGVQDRSNPREGQKDIQIADVTARRDGDRVMLTVLVKNLGDGSGTRHESKKFCVDAGWQTPSRFMASDRQCKTKTLWRDHVEELALVGFPVPKGERVEIHVSMNEEHCKECFQDADDGEWVLLSP